MSEKAKIGITRRGVLGATAGSAALSGAFGGRALIAGGAIGAATLAGIAFGNAGVHVPHAMSYSVAGLIRDYHPPGWPEEHSLCPHGISVVINAPAAFAFTAQACADRHLEAAGALGIDTRDADANDGGTLLVEKMSELMRLSGIPNGLEALGYGSADIPALVEGAAAQTRLLRQSPRPVSKADLEGLYRSAMRYW